MLVLVTYDIDTSSAEGKKRLSKVAKTCCNYGQRVQNSVFECDVDHAGFIRMKEEILKTVNCAEDSIRFYNLGNKYQSRIQEYGRKESYDPEGVLLL